MFIYNKERIIINTDNIIKIYLDYRLEKIWITALLNNNTYAIIGGYETIELAEQKFDDIRNLLNGELVG